MRISLNKNFILSKIIFLILFMFIFGWKITEYIDIILFSSFFLIVFSFLKYRKEFIKYSFNRHSLVVLISLYVLIMYSLLILVINSSNDIQFVLRTIRASINFLGGLALLLIYKNKLNSSGEILVSHIYYNVSEPSRQISDMIL